MTSFAPFLLAAFLLAIAPGPGLAYVVSRTVVGGRGEGLASCAGTAVGAWCTMIGLGAWLAVTRRLFPT